jgi:hypothetical protein
MFQKFTSANKPVTFIKDPQTNGQEKYKDMFDKLSRIEESYVDAAIRSVNRKFSGRKNIAFES